MGNQEQEIHLECKQRIQKIIKKEKTQGHRDLPSVESTTIATTMYVYGGEMCKKEKQNGLPTMNGGRTRDGEW